MLWEGRREAAFSVLPIQPKESAQPSGGKGRTGLCIGPQDQAGQVRFRQDFPQLRVQALNARQRRLTFAGQTRHPGLGMKVFCGALMTGFLQHLGPKLARQPFLSQLT